MPLKPLLPAAATAVLVVGLLAANSVFAASGTLHVTSATVVIGEQVTVALVANVGEPGLGFWTIDVQYDPMALNVRSCQEQSGSVCGPDFGDDGDLIRVTGAFAAGHVGEVTLATMTFECKGSGISSLDAIISVFADATDGDPQDIDPLSVAGGAIACVEEAEPTATATAAATEPMPTAAATSTAVASATAAAVTLPDTGSGPTGSDAIGWLAIALAAAGLVAIAGFAALRALGGAGGGR